MDDLNDNEVLDNETVETITDPMADQMIESVKVEDEMQKSYLDYSMSVIVGRSLPDARDGMKPVHRRSIFTIRKMGVVHNQAHVKSARVVGEVMGKYHPHGDSSIYETIVRLAQPFSMRQRLVDGHGNFGNIDGYGAAASRYTEVRMCELAEDLCEDMDKDTVDMVANYDGTLEEPTVLPAKIPNLLLNGSSGIAVGMATNIPTHNLGELCDAVKHQVDNPGCTVEDLMEFVKGPDFPTGAIICGRSAIYKMYKEGRASIKLRAKAEIKQNSKGNDQIIVTEIPYGVNKKQMLVRIGELIKEKQIEGIQDVKDFSKGNMGVEIVFTIKKDAQADIVLNHLYRLTELQSNFPANMLALDHGTPRRMSLKQFLKCFIDHRVEVITRRTRYLLKKAEERKHILEGFKIAIDNIDEVIQIIRSSKDDDEAKLRLFERFGLDDIQATAILDMRLRQLTGLQREKVEEEYQQLLKNIEEYKAILADEGKVLAIIKADMDEVKGKYAAKDPRRTEIADDLGEGGVNPLDFIEKEPCVITLSNRNYIKRTPLDAINEQNRGGKGRIGAKTKDGDFIKRVVTCSTHDKLLFFTSYGKVFEGMAYQIPELEFNSTGKAVVNGLKLDVGVPEGTVDSYGVAIPARAPERVLNIITLGDAKRAKDEIYNDTEAIFFATKKGIVKKTMLSQFINVNKNGIRAITFGTDDELVGVELVEKGDELFLVSAGGQALHFEESGVRDMGRSARGVRGMKLNGVTFGSAEMGDDNAEDDGDNETESTSAEVDEIRALVKVDKTEDSRILLIVENGYGVLTKPESYTIHKRGGKGMKSISTGSRNGKVVYADCVHTGTEVAPETEGGESTITGADSLLVITAGGQMIRTSVANIRECGRGSMGVKVVTVADGDKVISASTAAAEE